MFVHQGQLLNQFLRRPQLHYLIGYLLDQIDELAGFGRGNPRKVEATRFDAHVLDEIFEEGEFSSGVIITFQVMAVPRVSAGYPDPVCTLSKSCQKKLGIHPAGTGHPDCPDVWWILQSAHTGKICGAVRAPVAEEGDYFGLPISISWFGHILNLDLFQILWEWLSPPASPRKRGSATSESVAGRQPRPYRLKPAINRG
jgi:hypothetical protein